MSFLHKLHNVAHAVGEYVTPVLNESAFEERGVLTPEEFVRAGDQLVRMCPTWQWASGDPSKKRGFLPDDKQFLITRGVACEHRVRDLEATYSAELEVEGVEGEDESWLATHNNSAADNGFARKKEQQPLDLRSVEAALPKENEPTPSPAPAPAPAPASKDSTEAASSKPEPTENEDGFIDLDDFVEEGLDSTNAGSTENSNAKEQGKAQNGDSLVEGSGEADDGLVKMRTYDLSITYDKYYQTPRVWLHGYDEQQQPLSGEAVLEDIMQDYANKTVTIEPHPQLAGGVRYASIHPCKHADVMKKIVAQLNEGGKKADPSQYLFIFLKFIQSVIPTINYDNTIEVAAQM
ncbi:Autophagy-related protein 3 [Hondaea fermentalgiana]|uniref:Autophagy-related protein 3 n=1 Tax=Hondaea fermentalgiana TaxID=2315210 RepID=A0A2R5H0Y7_9STRA|nr:Autophagy-related protein 3 [Hondaea fermentalgiana]|eukprot:GBG34733.1 Autophagy-related protein 3 [Hondaea fermentalgiana]